MRSKLLIFGLIYNDTIDETVQLPVTGDKDMEKYFQRDILFDATAEEFVEMIKKVIPEFMECQYYGIEMNEIDETSDLYSSIQILTVIFSYVKEFSPEHRSMIKMIQVLAKVIDAKEINFLIDDNTTLDREMKRKIKNGEAAKEAYLAALVLDYYRFAFKPFTSLNQTNLFLKSLNYIRWLYDASKSVGKRTHIKYLPKNPRFPSELKNYLDEYVIGHDTVKKELAMSVYHYLIQGNRSPILILGDTGTGKNHMISTLNQYMREKNIAVPVITYDLTEITANGFSGNSKDDIFKLLNQKARQMRVESNRGIIFLDEATKLMMPNYESNGENVNRTIQMQLLSMLTGIEIAGVDTKNILFILGGASEDLRMLRKDRERKVPLGFISGEAAVNNKKSFLREDLLKVGMERELLGRITKIVEMEKLSSLQLKQIILHEKVGPIALKRKEYALDNLELIVDDDVLDLIVDMAMQENLGARSAFNVFQDLVGSYSYDMLEQGYRSIRIHVGMITDGEPPIFESKYEEDEDEAYRAG